MNEKKALKRLVAASRKEGAVSDFADGTVIRWMASQKYTYAALRTPVGWVTTSRYGYPGVPKTMTFEQLLQVIARPETTDVMLAVEWAEIS